MKIRYFRSGVLRKARKAERRKEEKQTHKEEIAKWHSTFIIWPRKIETPEDESCFATVVFFEKVWQKGRIINNMGIDTYDKTVWIRHREKEYFVKKLDGTLEPEENFSHDGVDMTNVSC